MNQSTQKKKYKEFIQGKKVCFVGTGSFNIGSNLGKFIDSFDVVARTNNSIELVKQKAFQVDYGKKLNVLYINNQFKRNTPDLVNHSGLSSLDWLCTKSMSDDDFELYNYKVDTRSIGMVINRIMKTCRTSTMGNFLWQDILDCDPEIFFIFGVDFFANRKAKFDINDNYPEYYPGYLTPAIMDEGNRVNVGKIEDAHNFLENAKYTDFLRKQYKNFCMEKSIHDLLDGILAGKVNQRD